MQKPASVLSTKGEEDREILREILVDVASDGLRASDIIQNVRNTVKKGDPTWRRINLNELVTKSSTCRQAGCGRLLVRAGNVAGEGPAIDRGRFGPDSAGPD